jgi:hypothetical protein
VLALNLGGGSAREIEKGEGGPLPGSPTVTALVSFRGVAHGAMPVTVKGYAGPSSRQATQCSSRKCYHGQAPGTKCKRSGRTRPAQTRKCDIVSIKAAQNTYKHHWDFTAWKPSTLPAVDCCLIEDKDCGHSWA